MTIDKCDALAREFLNGNIGDFRRGVRALSKANLILFVGVFAEYFVYNSAVNSGVANWGDAYTKALNVVHRALTDR